MPPGAARPTPVAAPSPPVVGPPSPVRAPAPRGRRSAPAVDTTRAGIRSPANEISTLADPSQGCPPGRWGRMRVGTAAPDSSYAELFCERQGRPDAAPVPVRHCPPPLPQPHRGHGRRAAPGPQLQCSLADFVGGKTEPLSPPPPPQPPPPPRPADAPKTFSQLTQDPLCSMLRRAEASTGREESAPVGGCDVCVAAVLPTDAGSAQLVNLRLPLCRHPASAAEAGAYIRAFLLNEAMAAEVASRGANLLDAAPTPSQLSSRLALGEVSVHQGAAGWRRLVSSSQIHHGVQVFVPSAYHTQPEPLEIPLARHSRQLRRRRQRWSIYGRGGGQDTGNDGGTDLVPHALLSALSPRKRQSAQPNDASAASEALRLAASPAAHTASPRIHRAPSPALPRGQSPASRRGPSPATRRTFSPDAVPPPAASPTHRPPPSPLADPSHAASTEQPEGVVPRWRETRRQLSGCGAEQKLALVAAARADVERESARIGRKLSRLEERVAAGKQPEEEAAPRRRSLLQYTAVLRAAAAEIDAAERLAVTG
eukprot:TRINITY_DN3476_c0_g2_i1.p1 TRINITY_DN3476_c0_g2~~TRINITY_DN3476_c0_g2_i1.p1  ORF type:complete len:615 (+),score=208.16 TRINITY_DN3476_c0_g2_i1:231-1847(+)